MFSIPLVLDYFLSSMPTIYRFGLSRVLVISWNSNQFLVTILSLSLLDGTTPSTLPWSTDIGLRWIHPVAVRRVCFLLHFFLIHSFFFIKLALLCFSFLIFQIIFLQYFYLFHIIPCLPDFHSAVCVFELVYKYFLSGISSNLLTLDAMIVELIRFGKAMLSFFSSCFLCYRVETDASNGILLLSLDFLSVRFF